jgi:serine/threonine-protein kinase
MPLARLCHIGKQLARGLAAAHAAKVIHRDLKPDNVMLVERGTERDFVKILDFGIAKIGASQMTRAGSVFGTPHYMSPEQGMGKPVDHRTDVYALGIILYEMASGKVPFGGTDTMNVIINHVQRAPAPLGTVVPNVPRGLDAIVMRCLAKSPDHRYPTMDAVAADLEQLERRLPVAAERSGSYPVGLAPGGEISAAPARPPPRWPLYLMLGVSVLILSIVALVLAVKLGHGRAAHGATPTPTKNAGSLPFA